MKTDTAPNTLVRARGRMPSVVRALELALLGVESPAEQGPLSNPRTAAALTPGSRAQPVEVCSGTWAVSRISADAKQQVLCVHNVSDGPVVFEPAQYLTEQQGTQPQLYFLSGSSSTGTNNSFVWIGRFGSTDSLEGEFQ
jgi:hypothetical protein